jgi:hypothetical protein
LEFHVIWNTGPANVGTPITSTKPLWKTLLLNDLAEKFYIPEKPTSLKINGAEGQPGSRATVTSVPK